MRELLAKLFYPSIFEEVERLENQNYQLAQQKDELYWKCKDQEEVIDLIQYLTGQLNHHIISIEKIKDEPFMSIVSCVIRNDQITIQIHSSNRPARKPVATLYAERIDPDLWHIIDIPMAEENVNRGYGSIAMKHFLKMARSEKVRHITGKISDVDMDHFDRIAAFYRKFKFEIDGVNISLNLT